MAHLPGQPSGRRSGDEHLVLLPRRGDDRLAEVAARAGTVEGLETSRATAPTSWSATTPRTSIRRSSAGPSAATPGADPLHGQGGDPRLAADRLAGPRLGRLLRATRRGRPGSAARGAGASRRGAPDRHLPGGDPLANGVLREPKFGVSLLAMRSGAPLLPVGISGSGKIFPGRSRWPHRTARRHPHREAIPAAPPARPGASIARPCRRGPSGSCGEIAALLPELAKGSIWAADR